MCELPERNFLVKLVSRDDGATHQIVVTSPCACDMQAFVDSIAADLPITSPRVADIDDKAAFYLPVHVEVPAAS